MRRIICCFVCALMLTVPASASAGVDLSKSEARSVVVDVLDGSDFVDEYPEADWYVSYWVERARLCKRVSRRVVDCEFTIYSDEMEDPDSAELVLDYCDGVMRIREQRDEYLWSDHVVECDVVPA